MPDYPNAPTGRVIGPGGTIVALAPFIVYDDDEVAVFKVDTDGTVYAVGGFFSKLGATTVATDKEPGY